MKTRPFSNILSMVVEHKNISTKVNCHSRKINIRIIFISSLGSVEGKSQTMNYEDCHCQRYRLGDITLNEKDRSECQKY